MFVVAVFSSGWQLMVACSISRASSTTFIRRSMSLMSAKTVTDPGVTFMTSSSSSGLAKQAVRPEQFMQGFHIDDGGAECRNQIQTVALVLQEQVLGMATGDVVLELRALGDRVDGLVLDRCRGDAKLGEPGHERGTRGGHL
jgi:hypothetical protein